MYCGSTAYFKAKVLPQLNEALQEGPADRVIVSMESYNISQQYKYVRVVCML